MPGTARARTAVFHTAHLIISHSQEKGKLSLEAIVWGCSLNRHVHSSRPGCLPFVDDVNFSLKSKSTVKSSGVRFVQFFVRLGCGKGVPDPRSQPVLLQYSLNGGLSWSLLQEFLFSNSSNVGRYIALEMPLKARSASTRLRWWQPSENGHFYSPWVIDQVSPVGIICFNFYDLRERARVVQGGAGGSLGGWSNDLPKGTRLD